MTVSPSSPVDPVTMTTRPSNDIVLGSIDRVSVLERVTSPSDLRALSRVELDALCAEIRAFLVDAVQRTGGHISSSLGATELTVALHRVFDPPSDKLVWDTGHQAYVHKMLTGRRD